MRPDRHGMARWLAAGLIALALLLPGLRAMAAEDGARRLALLIGNDDYLAQPKLQKAGGDVAALKRAFEKLGFAVTLAQNLDYGGMALALANFEAAIQPGDTVVFHFAGHGVSIKGRNYLLPIDFPVASGRTAEALIPRRAFDAGEVIDNLRAQGARLTFAVLDACRDNPIGGGGSRSVGLSRGLARMDAPSGVFILFSAGPGETALDRLGDDDADPVSVFTRAFLPNLEAPGLSLVAIAKKTQADVRRLASSVGATQFPDYSDRVEGDVVLAPAAAVPAPASDALQLDLAFWNEIRGDDPSLFQAYLDRFGDKGMFAPIARQRLAALASRREADERRAAEDRRRAEEARRREERRAEDERRRAEQRAADEARRQAEAAGRTAALLEAPAPADKGIATSPPPPPPGRDSSDPWTERAWFDAQADGSTAALQAFAAKFPDHPLAAEARALVEARVDDAAFREASAQGTREAMQAYLRARPRGRHRDKAAAIVATTGLSAWVDRDYAADRQKDDEEFRLASEAGTREALAAYLKARPKGRHRDEAAKGVARLAAQGWFGLSAAPSSSAAAATAAPDPRAGTIVAAAPSPTVPEITPAPAWLATPPLDGLRPPPDARLGLGPIAFSSDGGRFFAGTAEGGLLAFDLASGGLLFSRTMSDGVVAIAAAPDGATVAATLTGLDIAIVDASTGSLVRTLPRPATDERSLSLAYAPDGRWLVTFGVRTLKLWSPATGKPIRALRPRGNVEAAAFSGDGRRLAAATDTRIVEIWETATGKLLQTLQAAPTSTAYFSAVAVSPDGRLVATGGSGLHVWAPAKGPAPVQELTLGPGETLALVFSKDGTRLATSGKGGVVAVWDTATWRVVRSPRHHGDWIEGLAFSPDGKLLASSGKDGTIRIWRASDGAAAGILMPLKGGAAAAIAADGRYVASPEAEARLAVEAGGATYPVDSAYRARWRRSGSAALTGAP